MTDQPAAPQETIARDRAGYSEGHMQGHGVAYREWRQGATSERCRAVRGRAATRHTDAARHTGGTQVEGDLPSGLGESWEGFATSLPSSSPESVQGLRFSVAGLRGTSLERLRFKV